MTNNTALSNALPLDADCALLALFPFVGWKF